MGLDDGLVVFVPFDAFEVGVEEVGGVSGGGLAVFVRIGWEVEWRTGGRL